MSHMTFSSVIHRLRHSHAHLPSNDEEEEELGPTMDGAASCLKPTTNTTHSDGGGDSQPLTFFAFLQQAASNAVQNSVASTVRSLLSAYHSTLSRAPSSLSFLPTALGGPSSPRRVAGLLTWHATPTVPSHAVAAATSHPQRKTGSLGVGRKRVSRSEEDDEETTNDAASSSSPFALLKVGRARFRSEIDESPERNNNNAADSATATTTPTWRQRAAGALLRWRREENDEDSPTTAPMMSSRGLSAGRSPPLRGSCAAEAVGTNGSLVVAVHGKRQRC